MSGTDKKTGPFPGPAGEAVLSTMCRVGNFLFFGAHQEAAQSFSISAVHVIMKKQAERLKTGAVFS